MECRQKELSNVVYIQPLMDTSNQNHVFRMLQRHNLQTAALGFPGNTRVKTS